MTESGKGIRMKITYELNLDKFEAWSGGEDTLSRIRDEGKEDEFCAMLEELHPCGIDETELNDLLRFEADWIYESLGMKTDEELEEEKSERMELAKSGDFDGFCATFDKCGDCPLCSMKGKCEDCFEEWRALQ